MRPELVKRLAQECGFELAGITPAVSLPEAEFYLDWARAGMAGEMRYLTDHRAEKRADPRSLLPSARSILCVGKLYNGPQPYSTRFTGPERAWISRYAWGDDYHDVLRRGLERLRDELARHAEETFDSKICVDTAPLLERAYARRAGLGWIGRNTCLIHEGAGSWFFLGELLLSLPIEPDSPPPDRCGTCTRCIDACPTQALVPTGLTQPAWALDSRRCISYTTIELRGPVPESVQAASGANVFGCDICQDVCPWNRRAPVTTEPSFAVRDFAPRLERLATISEPEFRAMFAGTPIARARYTGFLRNLAVAMGNSGLAELLEPLGKLASYTEPLVRAHAEAALARLRRDDSVLTPKSVA